MNIKLIFPSMAYIIIGLLFFLAMRTVPFVMLPEMIGMLLGGLIACVFFFLLSLKMLNYEKLELSSMHLIPNKKTFMRLLIGLAIGAVIVGFMLYALFSLTNLSLERHEAQTMFPFLLTASIIIPLALMEELLFRGYPFFRLSQLLNIRWVLLITAVLFALYHYNGTNSLTSLLLGPGIWGVAFGVAAYLSKSLAVPLGMHISANALQAVFGLKPKYVPMWEMTQSTSLTVSIEAEQLGLIMQILLLIISIVVLEFSLYKKKSIQKKVVNIQSCLNDKSV